MWSVENRFYFLNILRLTNGIEKNLEIENHQIINNRQAVQ